MNDKFKLPNNVRDALREHLPSQISDMLREELDKGQKAIKENKEYKIHVADLINRLSVFGNLDTERKALNTKRKKIEDIEKDLSQREFDLENTILKEKLEASSRYSLQVEGALSGLVRNTQWRDQVHNFELSMDTDYRNDGSGITKETKHPSDSTKTAE